MSKPEPVKWWDADTFPTAPAGSGIQFNVGIVSIDTMECASCGAASVPLMEVNLIQSTTHARASHALASPNTVLACIDCLAEAKAKDGAIYGDDNEPLQKQLVSLKNKFEAWKAEQESKRAKLIDSLRRKLDLQGGE